MTLKELRELPKLLQKLQAYTDAIEDFSYEPNTHSGGRRSGISNPTQHKALRHAELETLKTKQRRCRMTLQRIDTFIQSIPQPHLRHYIVLKYAHRLSDSDLAAYFHKTPRTMRRWHLEIKQNYIKKEPRP